MQQVSERNPTAKPVLPKAKLLTTPFHAYYKAKKLLHDSKLLPAFASASLDVYPYQVAAASFALDAPFGRGVVLADEGSLGKTYGALLIISQKWFEGAQKILIIVPVHLTAQWVKVLEDNFNIPYSTENADEDGIYLTTYESDIPACEWDIACFDEAQRLRNDNETNRKLKAAVENYTGTAKLDTKIPKVVRMLE